MVVLEMYGDLDVFIHLRWTGMDEMTRTLRFTAPSLLRTVVVNAFRGLAASRLVPLTVMLDISLRLLIVLIMLVDPHGRTNWLHIAHGPAWHALRSSWHIVPVTLLLIGLLGLVIRCFRCSSFLLARRSSCLRYSSFFLVRSF